MPAIDEADQVRTVTGPLRLQAIVGHERAPVQVTEIEPKIRISGTQHQSPLQCRGARLSRPDRIASTIRLSGRMEPPFQA